MESETIPHEPLPPPIAAEVRELLSRCRLFTRYGGSGWLTVPAAETELIERLLAGWRVGLDERQMPIIVRCAEQHMRYKEAPDAATVWTDLNLPAEFVPTPPRNPGLAAPALHPVKQGSTAMPKKTDPFDAAQPADNDTSDDGLFAATAYNDPRLILDQVDGRDIDKIGLELTGQVLLDRKSPQHVDFMRRLKLGGSVTLQVEAKVAGKKQAFTTGKEGELDAIVYRATLKCEDVHWPTAEELGEPTTAVHEAA